MKKKFISLIVLASICCASFLYAADKVVVIPMGKRAVYTNKTFYYNLPPSSFTATWLTPDGPEVHYIAGEWLMVTGATEAVGLAAPVQLPDGAEITDFTCYAYDNHATRNISSNSPVSIWRRAVLSADRETITTEFNMPTTGASTSIQSFSAPSIDYPTVDNTEYFYGAYALYKLDGASVSNVIRFYGCRITYTLDVLTP